MEATDGVLFSSFCTRVLSVSKVCMAVRDASEDGAKECVLADVGQELVGDVFVSDEVVVLGVKKLLKMLFPLCWRPCTSFSANIES